MFRCQFKPIEGLKIVTQYVEFKFPNFELVYVFLKILVFDSRFKEKTKPHKSKR